MAITRIFKRGFFAAVLAQLLGRVGSILANVLMSALVARYLDQTAFGEVMFALTFIAILIQLADFGTNVALSRLIVEHKARGGALWANFLRARLLLCAIAMLVGVCFAFTRGQPWLLLLAVLAIPLAGSRFFDPVYQVYEKPWLSTQALAAYSIALLLLTLGVVALKGDQYAYVLAYAVANGIYCAAAWRGASACVRPVWVSSPALRRDIWQTAVPIGISALFTTLNTRGNMMVIEHYRNFLEVGLFGGAARVLDLGVAFAAMALGPLIPIFSHCASDTDRIKTSFQEILKWVLLGLLPVILTSGYWAEPLVRLLYGAKYLAAAPAVAVLSGVGALATLCLLNSYVLLVLKQVRFGIWLSGAAALLSTGLNLWLVPRYGFMAAAWIALLTEALMCATTFVLLVLELGNIFERSTWTKLSAATLLSWIVLYGGWTSLPWLALGAGALGFMVIAYFSGLLRPDMERLRLLHRGGMADALSSIPPDAR